MTVNVELLDRTLAHVETHESEWNQTVWRCRTGMCFAGWAVTLDGGTWAYPETAMWDQESTDPRACLLADSDDPPGDIDDDDVVHVDDRARRVLGLNYEQGEDLFSSYNTLDDLRRIVADIKAGAS